MSALSPQSDSSGAAPAPSAPPAQGGPGSSSRRGFLQMAAAGVAGLLTTAGAAGSARADTPVSSAPPSRTRTLRVAYITDVHLQPERRAAEGFAECLRHIHSQPDKPNLVLGGGDFIMDGFAATRERTKTQWDLWTRVLKDEMNLPLRTCLGNHDIWGWNQEKSGANGSETDYGKKWAMDVLGQPGRYHAFTQGGWRFVALDSIQPGEKPGTYVSYLDEEQRNWLKEELLHTPPTMPVLIWSHAPLISALLQLTEKRATPFTSGTVQPNLVHSDGGELSKLFAGHPNVKLCLSGHLHMVEGLELRDVMYRCAGSVCGNWWRGPRDGFAEGYSMLDLYDDGSHTCTYVPFGWKAETDLPAVPVPAPVPASPTPAPAQNVPPAAGAKVG
ncbi:MAG: metallophosphoesterase [Candidatus Methylacidiphilales bacterium]